MRRCGSRGDAEAAAEAALEAAAEADAEAAAEAEVEAEAAAEAEETDPEAATEVEAEPDKTNTKGPDTQIITEEIKLPEQNKIAIEESEKNNSELPVTKIVDQFYSEVQDMGGGRWDTSSLIKRFRK